MRKAAIIVLGLVFTIGAIIGMGILLFRLFSHEELDDVHPLIMDVNDPYIKRSEWLWVIPLYMNDPLSNHPEWVQRLKAMGKKIGMHGVRHTKNEFGIDRSNEYIDKGINEFTKAFGYPSHFKAPGLALTKSNRKKLRDRNIKIKGNLNQISHRVHHSPKGRRSNGWLLGE
jgi:predicted deacetylase